MQITMIKVKIFGFGWPIAWRGVCVKLAMFLAFNKQLQDQLGDFLQVLIHISTWQPLSRRKRGNESLNWSGNRNIKDNRCTTTISENFFNKFIFAKKKGLRQANRPAI